MRRLLFLIACLAALVAAVPAGADHEPPELDVELTECEDGTASADRMAAFTASMPARSGTRRMAMRFHLYEKRAGGEWHRVRDVEGFGEWERSEAGRKGFVFTKRVDGLRERRWYHVKVDFRWYDARGHVQRRERERSRSCRQPDQRPNLTVDIRAAQPTPDGARARYFVAVENTGRTPSAMTTLRLLAGGGAPEERDVEGLEAGERVVIEVTGAPCAAGERVEAEVDPADRVDEGRERDNEDETSCPL